MTSIDVVYCRRVDEANVLSKVEGDGEVRVMTRGFGDLVAKLGDKVVMEVLVRCWSDGDVVPTSVPVSMEDSNLTMEEYIKLEAEEARKRDFPTIIYKDALAPDHEISSEFTVSPHRDNRIDFDFKISFDESDNDDYIVSYDKNLFSYKLTYVNDLKPDSDNDKVEINLSSDDIIVEPSDGVIDVKIDTHFHEFVEGHEVSHNIPDMARLPPKDQRHLWLRYKDPQYTDAIILDLETRLGRIFDRQVNRVQVLDFARLIDEIGRAVTDRLRMVHTRAEGQVLFTSDAWRRVFEIRGPLVPELMLEFFSTCRISDTVLELDDADTLCF
ncbi:hypothetical protein Tco_0646615 [Tanacetum coccineum]